MSHKNCSRVPMLALSAQSGPALAGVVTLNGALGDNTNTSLVVSDLGPAQFSDDLATANNVALHALHVVLGGNVGFSSNGVALGGIDPYFTLFPGNNPTNASFLASNSLNAVVVGGDFTQELVLAAGDYTVAPCAPPCLTPAPCRSRMAPRWP